MDNETFGFEQALKYMKAGIPVTRPCYNGYKMTINNAEGRDPELTAFMGINSDRLFSLRADAILSNDWSVAYDD